MTLLGGGGVYGIVTQEGGRGFPKVSCDILFNFLNLCLFSLVHRILYQTGREGTEQCHKMIRGGRGR